MTKENRTTAAPPITLESLGVTPEQYELGRIHATLDRYAIPQVNPDQPEVKLSAVARLRWLIKHYGVNVDDLNHMERLQRLNGFDMHK